MDCSSEELGNDAAYPQTWNTEKRERALVYNDLTTPTRQKRKGHEGSFVLSVRPSLWSFVCGCCWLIDWLIVERKERFIRKKERVLTERKKVLGKDSRGKSRWRRRGQVAWGPRRSCLSQAIILDRPFKSSLLSLISWTTNGWRNGTTILTSHPWRSYYSLWRRYP